jgi:predicted porin
VTGDGKVNWLDDDSKGMGLYTPRAKGIHYSGNFNGVGVMAFGSYESKERDSAVPDTEERMTGFGVGVSYASGPFAIGAAAQRFTAKAVDSFYWDTPADDVDTENTEYGIGASYDFGPAKLHGHWMANKPKGYKAYNQLGLGVTVPMGAVTLGAQYAYNRAGDFDGMTGVTAKGHDFVLEGKYALSKRTDLYARVGRYNSFKWTAGGDQYKSYNDVAAIGVRHRF